jgi:hypothetical protein
MVVVVAYSSSSAWGSDEREFNKSVFITRDNQLLHVQQPVTVGSIALTSVLNGLLAFAFDRAHYCIE